MWKEHGLPGWDQFIFGGSSLSIHTIFIVKMAWFNLQWEQILLPSIGFGQGSPIGLNRAKGTEGKSDQNSRWGGNVIEGKGN